MFVLLVVCIFVNKNITKAPSILRPLRFMALRPMSHPTNSDDDIQDQNGIGDDGIINDGCVDNDNE